MRSAASDWSSVGSQIGQTISSSRSASVGRASPASAGAATASARRRGRRRRASRPAQRSRDERVEPLEDLVARVDPTADLADDAARAVDDERLGERRHAVVAERVRPARRGRSGTSSRSSRERPRVALEVVRSRRPTTTSPASRYSRHAASSTGASSLHGSHQEAQKLTITALPRSDDERELAVAVEARQRERGRRRRRAARDLASERSLRSSCTTFQTSSTSSAGHGRERECLGDELRAPGHRYAETMKTGVPTRPARTATPPRGSASGCSRARPSSRSSAASGVPWMPTPGDEIPIQRVPSGLPGPGRDRLLALRPVGVGRVPPRVLPLDDDLEAAERRRIARLAGGDAERAPRPHPVVEVEPVRAAPDDDDRAEALARDGRLDQLRAAAGSACAGCGRAPRTIASVAPTRSSDRPATSFVTNGLSPRR